MTFINLSLHFHFLLTFSSPEKTKEKKKDDHDQENPSDFSDPSAEQKERLLNIDEEIADDDDKEIAKMETKASEYSDISSRCLRSLVYVDKSSKVYFVPLWGVGTYRWTRGNVTVCWGSGMNIPSIYYNALFSSWFGDSSQNYTVQYSIT